MLLQRNAIVRMNYLSDELVVGTNVDKCIYDYVFVKGCDLSS